MRIAIIQFPGSTCTRETLLAVLRAGMKPQVFLWNDDLDTLYEYAGYVLVGGFSYEDRARAGVLAALHPLMDVLKERAEDGSPVLGICNGAQILVESGMVPGVNGYQLAMALSENKRTSPQGVIGSGFYNTWSYVCMHRPSKHHVFTRFLKKDQRLHLPIAHGEGRFQLSASLWSYLQQHDVCSLHYCDARGVMHDTAPTNPNGSAYNLAALSNLSGNVMAIMPHPERAKEGDILFQSMRDYLQEKPKRVTTLFPLYHEDAMVSFPHDYYQCPIHAVELIVAPLLTDNHALAIARTLEQQGLQVLVRRYTHWEVHGTRAAVTELIASDSVLNPNKEQWIERANEYTEEGRIEFLIRAKEDLLGQQKQLQVTQHQAINDIHQMKHSILWQLDCQPQDKKKVIHYVLQAHLLFNPQTQYCYVYGRI